ncbi:hypothetical protein EIP86_005806 [Pleurotus ostreatoroseus]|nr:hypothetical protein EIP86_005806 [Pleurotus ostreatoroseus]
MHTLPLELHSQIFDLACSDDGTTARALVRVSRYVRSVAEPFLYQSLAVAGSSPLTELLERLERVPAHKRRVRRLFLSDWSHKQVRQKSAPTADADMDRYDLEKSLIIRLLDLVGPTLHSLAFLVSCPFNGTQLIGHLFTLKLPNLRDLSVHGFYPFPHLPHVMPRLQHLHLSGNRNPHGLLQVGALAEACPRVETLRISGLVSAASFVEELGNSLHPSSQTTRSLLSAELPVCIRKIVVQTGPAPAKARRYSSASAQHDKMLERLSMIDSGLQSESPPGVQFVLIGKHEDDIFLSMKREWAESSSY